jgi:hypothetical protein
VLHCVLFCSAASSSGDASSGDAVFLVTVLDAWLDMTIWTMLGVGLTFFGAGIQACRVHVQKTSKVLWIVIPLSAAILGVAIGFLQGTVSAALVAAISMAIPYPLGLDIAAGLGFSQAIIIVYFHLGRADFIHR